MPENHSPNGMTYTVQCRDILALKSNIANFRWPFGYHTPPSSSEDFNRCALRASIVVQPDSAFAEVRQKTRDHGWGRYHYLSGQTNGQLVFYQRPFLFGSEIYLEVSNLSSQEPLIRLNWAYFRLIHFRFMNLHSASYVLMDLINLLLLLRKLTPIYCSAFKYAGHTVLIFAPSSIGKTLTTMKACLEKGADFISEDLAITNGRDVFGLPWTSSFRHYGKRDIRGLNSIKQLAVQLLPFLDLLPITRNKSVSSYLPQKRICHHSSPTHIVILERGKADVSTVSKEVVFRKILNLNRTEFNYQRSLVNNAYEYFNPDINISVAQKNESAILQELVRNVRECFVVRTHNSAEYIDLILQSIT